MLITPLPLQSTLPAKIKSALRPVLNELEPMTFAKVKARCRESGMSGLSLAAEGVIHRQKNGGVRSIELHPYKSRTSYANGTRGPLGPDRFHCVFAVGHGLSGAITGMCEGLFAFLAKEEADRRRSESFRELIMISEEKLLSLKDELNAFATFCLGDTSIMVEEALLLAVVENEIEARQGETGHSRMAVLRRAKPRVDAARKAIEEELMLAAEAGPAYHYWRRFMHASISDVEATALERRHNEFFRLLRGF